MIEKIRNFCIIAHIDHGKSTLADRLLEVTGTVEERKMQEQLLDSMDLERERGITIKLQPARMQYSPSTSSGTNYFLNLIDTPGHVDFSYEVSRSLAAVEGAILLVDATQGMQAQTLANLYLALDQDLEIVPVMNKIDLPNSDEEKVAKEIMHVLGCEREEILSVSAKTGAGVEELLDALVERVPAPTSEASKGLRALIFDSVYDEYQGVLAYVRVVSGTVKRADGLYFVGTDAKSVTSDVGVFQPEKKAVDKLGPGEIGYIATGLKDVAGCRVGDTIISGKDMERAGELVLSGYEEMKPMVYAGLYPKDGDMYPRLRDGMEKLKLTDASLQYDPDNSPVLGFGFRCGFLGLLHLEIIQERIAREFGVELVVTTPSVAYSVTTTTAKQGTQTNIVNSAQHFPETMVIDQVEEPWVSLDIVTTSEYLGGIMELATRYRGEYKNTEYLETERIILHFELPLASILVDFYDKLKSVSSGFASMNYTVIGYRPADVVKMDILIAEESVEALSMIVYRDEVQTVGKRVVATLKDVLPRQQFVLKIQAALGGKIVAAERLSAMRKDVTAKLYGGDVTRKRKLLEKQKKGKKKMMQSAGKVDIPSSAYMAVLKRE